MAHIENNENLSPEERKFLELMRMGDDFFKIEIYRSAIHWYKEAAKLKPGNDKAKQQVAECEKLLDQERKVIYILVSIAAVVVFLVWIL
jgi:hypothetical protein